MLRRLSLFVATFAFSAASAFASTLLVSESGTFATGTPTTTYSTSGGTFSYSFNISSTPTVTGVSTGRYFQPTISNFTYTLNGVSTTPTVGTEFFNIAEFGLLDICFASACNGGIANDGFVFEGLQAYSGSESSPTILTGSYTPTFALFKTATTETFLANETNLNIAVAATPEPSSIALLGTGMLGVVGVVRKRFAA